MEGGRDGRRRREGGGGKEEGRRKEGGGKEEGRRRREGGRKEEGVAVLSVCTLDKTCYLIARSMSL